ncbi:hypothetical protein [Arsukibacterium sp.]|uniref:hypothetical protein n=1 Tax=Arsukibacterium sp. TaxID=1977258 RepID=UPI00299E843B|nr:hypothetical protein [Arsukibacterium sp.]MDX1676644.1 hypothetical protein [Arsukibacterium sp.]
MIPSQKAMPDESTAAIFASYCRRNLKAMDEMWARRATAAGIWREFARIKCTLYW